MMAGSHDDSMTKLLFFAKELLDNKLVTSNSKFINDVLNMQHIGVNEFIDVIHAKHDPTRFIGQPIPAGFFFYASGFVDAYGITSMAPPVPSAPPPPVAPGAAYPPRPFILGSPVKLETVKTVVQTMVGWTIILAVGLLCVAGLACAAMAGWYVIGTSIDGVYSFTVSNEAQECRRNMSVLEARVAGLEQNVSGLGDQVVFFQDTSDAVAANMYRVGNETLDQIRVDASAILEQQMEKLAEFEENATNVIDQQTRVFESSNRVMDAKVKAADEKVNQHVKVLGEKSGQVYANITATNKKLKEGYSDLDGRLKAANVRLAPLEENVNILAKTLPLISEQAKNAEESTANANLILERTSNGWLCLYQWTSFYFVCVIVVSVIVVRIWVAEEPVDVPFTKVETSHDFAKAVKNLDKRTRVLEADMKNMKSGTNKIGNFMWNTLFGESPSRA